VTLRDFVIDANGTNYGIEIYNGHSGSLFEYGEIYDTSSTGVYGLGVTLRYLYVHDSDGDLLKMQGSAAGPSLVEYSFIEKGGRADDAHADGNQTRGGHDITFRYNNFWMPALPPDYPGEPYDTNSTHFMQLEITNAVIEMNWLNGGNWTISCYDFSSEVSVRNNRFGRSYRHGIHDGTCAEWTNNVWDDTGLPIP
jgi:hypothetical protein